MNSAVDSRLRQHGRTKFLDMLLFCAPVPALSLGIIAMRVAGVQAGAWLANIAAGVIGLLLLAIVRRIPTPSKRRTQSALAAVGIATMLLPFLSRGVDGVHRWVSIVGLRLHASAIVAPLIIASVAAIVRRQIVAAVAISTFTTLILALQPDAGQATSFAAAF